MFKLVVIIPVYRHGELLGETIRQLAKYEIPLIVISDGNDLAQSRLIKAACCTENIVLLNRVKNGGKGAAIMDGLREAWTRGYSHALQIDADGQHDISRVPLFIKTAMDNPTALVLGYPCYNQGVPFARRLGRWLTHIWVWINSLSFKVRDSMCGFRVYPVELTNSIIAEGCIGQRMEFDSEVCVLACWRDVEIINLPVDVSYPKNGISNFRLKKDNIIISLMHARLFFRMLSRLPALLLLRSRNLFANKKASR